MGEDRKEMCQCNICHDKFTCKARVGTGHLLRHMEKCKKRDTRDVGQMLFSSNAHGNMTLSDCSFDPDKFRELVASAIAMHNLSFQFVEYRGIRACFEYLRPGVQQVSRNTAKADILKLYESEKMKIKNALATSHGRISLTFDLWTAINSDGYLAVTVHFVNRIGF
ncbi:zinc finger BED domain-containing protein RICESLEEPER 2-like [Canna indica]|uniref:Zinc finger BED domain-containing protein RICESLEEPER 2-like n=1 Tax=Canna indica TaxID=4628 RepID=A0AAQ3KDM1_9LILI|nr:zinc finger BED domain-containing protein RICESLEEPER 2-like [Canna indica]